MKAIQVKVLPATNTKPTRYKAWAEGCKPLVRSEVFDVTNQTHYIAWAFVMEHKWQVYDLLEGQLPNGDWVYIPHELQR